ncbi:MAG: hypothetical protein IT361_06800 [Gemmatimonadaceae bacterium]|nr:hypothetical protein [Gemmatimonadaceae bacterium]
METVVVVLGVVAFVVLAWRVGLLVNRFKHRRFVRAWQPLVGIIDGVVHEDPQGGGASSYLAGSWKGRTIHARMSPHVRSWEWQHHENRFGVGVANVAGRTSWMTTGDARQGERGLGVKSDDHALEERLHAAGVVERLRCIQCHSVHFESFSGYLFLEDTVEPLWAPPPERFVALLDAAVELARIHDQVNSGSAQGR